MIARGDLSVELGSARLAEIQEELLWLCEAAHVPVIWATQVLESVALGMLLRRCEPVFQCQVFSLRCVRMEKYL